MNNLRFRAVLFIACAIGVICMAIVATTFVPVDIYPHGERLRDYALFVQGVVTTVAIGAGAYVADRRFQIFRTFQPHLTIVHRITHRQLSESYIHIEVTAVLHNRSRVKTDLRMKALSALWESAKSECWNCSSRGELFRLHQKRVPQQKRYLAMTMAGHAQ